MQGSDSACAARAVSEGTSSPDGMTEFAMHDLEEREKKIKFAENLICRMVDIEFGLLEKVVYLNSATLNIEEGVVKGIRVVPTGISKDEKGNDVLDGYEVLYHLMNDVVLTSREVFRGKEQLLARYREALFAG